MKKKQSLLILFVFVLMAAAACSQPGAGTNSEAGITSAKQEETMNVSGETQEIEVKKKEYGTEEAVLEGKKLEQLIVTGTDHPFYCNLEENLKIKYDIESEPVLVCKDPVYDITYYVNYGRDNYIYAYRDGKPELAVEIPAKDLFCKEGELYFIAAKDDRYQFSGFAEGNILKYNPKDGAVTVVLGCSADKMVVYPDGICYKEIGETKQEGTDAGSSRKEEEFFFSFETGESSSKPVGVSGMQRWNGDWLKMTEKTQEFDSEVYEALMQDPGMQALLAQGFTLIGEGTGVVDTMALVDMQGKVKETLQNIKGIPKYFWISGDAIYYLESREEESGEYKVLKRYNKQTADHEDIAKLAYPTSLAYDDMIFYDGIVYFSNALRLELKSGAQCLMQRTDGAAPNVDYFYTDGENLFCVSNGKLWLFKEQPGAPIAAREFVAGMPLEIGTYVYQLCEP